MSESLSPRADPPQLPEQIAEIALEYWPNESQQSPEPSEWFIAAITEGVNLGRDAALPAVRALEHERDALEELLESAHAIAARRGAGTAWDRFAASIAALGIGRVTARTYRVLPSDTPDLTEAKVAVQEAQVRALEAEREALIAKNLQLEAQWGIMARACGNYRSFSVDEPLKPFTEWETREFQAAAAAILKVAAQEAEIRALEKRIAQLGSQLHAVTVDRDSFRRCYQDCATHRQTIRRAGEAAEQQLAAQAAEIRRLQAPQKAETRPWFVQRQNEQRDGYLVVQGPLPSQGAAQRVAHQWIEEFPNGHVQYWQAPPVPDPPVVAAVASQEPEKR